MEVVGLKKHVEIEVVRECVLDLDDGVVPRAWHDARARGQGKFRSQGARTVLAYLLDLVQDDVGSVPGLLLTA